MMRDACTVAGAYLHVELGDHPLLREVLLQRAKDALTVQVGIALEVWKRNVDVDNVRIAVNDHAGGVQLHCIGELGVDAFRRT
eukprot:6183328-Pleurochrysis_carterae.AAC.1